MTNIHIASQKFTPFSHLTAHQDLPQRFTFPYYYTPHPLALQAIEQLQHYLENQTTWLHDFEQQGVMFGVLVVKNQQNELGYLSSYAGCPLYSFDNEQIPPFFVDAIFDNSAHHHHFSQQESEINQLTRHINELENSFEFIELTKNLAASIEQSDKEITEQQHAMSLTKTQRKQARKEAELQTEPSLTPEDLNVFIRELGNQSSREKRELKALKQHWKETVSEFSERHNKQLNAIKLIKEKQAKLTKEIESAVLTSCSFLNHHGISKSLFELFTINDLKTTTQDPILYSSEQNLPKLLQTAFKMGYEPLALGEFWWGSSPYDQIRQHKNLYPVCQSKCFEIIQHMLDGIETDDSPLELTPSYGKELEIVYEDDVMVVVNKPAEFLSVSGKYITDSVHARIQERYPNATGPLIVHRLDMSTSGLLVLTLTAETNKHIQKQFIERTVEKRYTALLEGNIKSEHGIINLPLAGDMQDRPRQMVCHKHGRSAETTYEVISRNNNRTKVYLYPKTGRTHQLRVHCAHQTGLNTPIVGDDLYGFKDTRLHLHAGYLKLRHPITNNEMEFEVSAEF
ncbi:RluA family pseudouridine synthase [Aliivibrio sifiae]|uniref:RNA pseudouridine synthase n=1 Tax=Aliivibrio sifiae TaxID=566293 RepID=A0A2S7X7S0_9GAMM|nr:RluA family pseudouridine synthase [Aliivibrio sifiae]PQJ87317.1 RNA pseudouridine synthase [Aliivibrio sifiae]GLR76155.1 RNA pseudouridine synthase [Aliivibrio sifiae]